MELKNTDYSKGNKLIEELLANPVNFALEGKAYLLLQEYFNDYPLSTLIPLLNNNQQYVHSAAAFIVAELGVKGCSLIDHVVPLINSDNTHIVSDALDSVMVCSSGEKTDRFLHIIFAMESKYDAIRYLAMRLVYNASKLQIKSAILNLNTAVPTYNSHKEGLSVLFTEKLTNPEIILRMIDAEDALLRKYGIIVAKKNSEKFPEFMEKGKSSLDSDINHFVEYFIDLEIP